MEEETAPTQPTELGNRQTEQAESGASTQPVSVAAPPPAATPTPPTPSAAPASPTPDPAPAADSLIWAKDLTKQFNEQVAVNQVNFVIPERTIFGFIGPSGCGKTTTIRLLTGVYIPTSGEARVFGDKPRYFTRADRERIGYMPQHFVLYPDLTVWENLNFAASIYGVGYRRGRRMKELLEFMELYDDRGKLARNISGGMQRRLSLAATLVHKPPLLFLDEPTTGIDPILRRKLWDYFESLREGGSTLFVTTQYVGEAAYCDLVGIMSEGRVLLVDTPEGLRRRAFGGDVIDLRTNERLDYQSVQQINQLPFVKGRVERVDDNEVRVLVEDAGAGMPELVEWSQGQNLSIESIQEYLPPFDDVFVLLVKRYAPDE